MAVPPGPFIPALPKSLYEPERLLIAVPLATNVPGDGVPDGVPGPGEDVPDAVTITAAGVNRGILVGARTASVFNSGGSQGNTPQVLSGESPQPPGGATVLNGPLLTAFPAPPLIPPNGVLLGITLAVIVALGRGVLVSVPGMTVSLGISVSVGVTGVAVGKGVFVAVGMSDGVVDGVGVMLGVRVG